MASGLMASDMSRASLSAPTSYPGGVPTTAFGAAREGQPHIRCNLKLVFRFRIFVCQSYWRIFEHIMPFATAQSLATIACPPTISLSLHYPDTHTHLPSLNSHAHAYPRTRPHTYSHTHPHTRPHTYSHTHPHTHPARGLQDRVAVTL